MEGVWRLPPPVEYSSRSLADNCCREESGCPSQWQRGVGLAT